MRLSVGTATRPVGRSEEADGRCSHRRGKLEERRVAPHEEIAARDHPGQRGEIDLADEIRGIRAEVHLGALCGVSVEW